MKFLMGFEKLLFSRGNKPFVGARGSLPRGILAGGGGTSFIPPNRGKTLSRGLILKIILPRVVGFKSKA